MSKHIQMSVEAQAALKRNAKKNTLSALAACVAFLSIGASILYFTVVLIGGNAIPAFETYVAPAEDAPASKKPKVKELSTKTNSSSSHIAPAVIVAAEASDVSMAQIDIPTPDLVVGTGMDIDLGMGSGLGNGIGTGGGGLGSSENGGSALEGTFYDMKLTRNGASKGIQFNPETQYLVGNGPHLVSKMLGEFVSSNWDPKYLRQFYESPTKLYASNFIVPESKASYAPIAFKADKKVMPTGWLIIYRGKVRAPKTGKFRFVGNGDDLIAVKFNKKLVLEAGYTIPSFYNNAMTDCFAGIAQKGGDPEYQEKIATYPGHRDYKIYPHPVTGWWTRLLKGFTGGNVFNVEEGRVYPIEILISEVPGGQFGFVLLIEDLETPREKDGMPVFDLFRTNFSVPNAEELISIIKAAGAFYSAELPTYNEDSPIWTVVP